MATSEAKKSTQITNADATPSVLNPAYQDGGRVRCKRGVVATVAADADVGSTYRAFRIRSSDMVKDLVIDHSSWGTGAAADIGLYKTAKDGGAVVDADFFASAYAMAAAGINVNVLRESGIYTVANMEKRIWEALGLTVDPMIDYDVTLTLTGASTVAGANACLTGEVVGGH